MLHGTLLVQHRGDALHEAAARTFALPSCIRPEPYLRVASTSTAKASVDIGAGGTTGAVHVAESTAELAKPLRLFGGS